MRWRCVLIQRWLPEYPAGDLPSFWKRRLDSHLEHCPACLKEWRELREVREAVQAAPGESPGPEFWAQFSRDLHLKLAQAAQDPRLTQAAPGPWRRRLPYLLGAPALAVLALWATAHFIGLGPAGITSTQITRSAPAEPAKSPRLAATPKPAVTPAPAEAPENYAYVALYEDEASQENEAEVSSWDLDMELAGMTDQEKELFLKKLDQRKKDGSWVIRHSWFFWA
jgi:hypothetical protein